MKKFSPNSSFKLPFFPNQKAGQNFLFDKNYLQKIVKNCPIEFNTVIIEVGSGYGTLTNLLAETNCQKIISYEKDKRLFNWLAVNNQKKDKIIYFNEDILLVNWPILHSKHKNNPLIVVGNLPYYLANSLIIDLLINYQLFKSLIFLVQKEVAQRWVASPSYYSHKYSALSVFINFLTKSSLVLSIPAQIFTPSPTVDGGLVMMKIYSDFSIKREKLIAFWQFLKNCFRFRRKTLRNNLNNWGKNYEQEWDKYWQQQNYSNKLRPQNLSCSEYWQLFNKWEEIKD